MKKGIFIKKGVVIAVILTVVFLSQQPYAKPIGKKIFSYWEKSDNWLKTNIYPKVSGGVTDLEKTAKEKIEEQKGNIAKTIWEKIKNYFAEKFSKVFGTKVQ